jgi:hypothetical protein
MQHESSRDFLSTRSTLRGHQVFVDFRLLDERVQNVQDAVAAPDLCHHTRIHFSFRNVSVNWTHLAAISQHHQLFLVLLRWTRAPHAEALELIDELVDDVPEPLIWEFELDGTLRV